MVAFRWKTNSKNSKQAHNPNLIRAIVEFTWRSRLTWVAMAQWACLWFECVVKWPGSLHICTECHLFLSNRKMANQKSRWTINCDNVGSQALLLFSRAFRENLSCYKNDSGDARSLQAGNEMFFFVLCSFLFRTFRTLEQKAEALILKKRDQQYSGFWSALCNLVEGLHAGRAMHLNLVQALGLVSC